MAKENVKAIGMVRNLYFRRQKGMFALQIESLEVHSQEIAVLMGPNGAGKSTLGLMFSGVLAPEVGDVLVQGYQATTSQAKRYLSYLPEGGFLFAGLSGKDNIDIFAKLAAVALGQEEGGLHDEVLAILKDLRFPFRYFHAPIKTYSEGMRRKIELALVLAPRVSLYILDMPTKGLDIEAKQQLFNRFRALKARGGALLLSTHVSEEAMIIGDHFYFLAQGSIVARVTAEELDRSLATVVVVEPAALLERNRVILEKKGGVVGREQILFFNRPFADVQRMISELLGDSAERRRLRVSSRPPTLKDYYIFFTRGRT